MLDRLRRRRWEFLALLNPEVTIRSKRCRVSCSDAAPAVVRTARPPCSRCTSASKHCHVPLAQAQALVTIKDSIDAGSKELQVKQQLDGCVTKCVDDQTHYIPTMTKKMKEALLSTGK
ncbi:hypothetical protein H8959_000578 [Pygathrix nigripes]